MKSDKSKNDSGYGLLEYIGEEKILEKNNRKNGGWKSRERADFWPNFNFAAIFWTLSRKKSDKSNKVWRYGLYEYIGEKIRFKKKITKKWLVDTKYPPDRIFRIFDWPELENYAT